MTASSPWTVGMIETRKSIVLPRTRSLKRPSCGTRFSAMSSSDMTLMREMIVLWCRLSIGSIACYSTPSMRYLTCDRVVLGLDVDVGGAALERLEDDRVDEPDDRAGVRRELVDGEGLFARLVLAEELHLEAFGGLLEHALRALALLQNRLDRRRRADAHADRRAQLDADLVDRLQVARIGHDDQERLAVAAVRHEPVAQHQVGRDAPEQRVVRMEVLEIDELQLVALGQPPRLAPLRPRDRSAPPRARRRAARLLGETGSAMV